MKPPDVDGDDDSVTARIAAHIKSSVLQLESLVFRIRGKEKQLKSDRTYPLKTGDRIKTDESGTAEVNIADCMTIYVFAASGLSLSTCPGARTGNVLCNQFGTSTFNNRCNAHIRKVETDTAEIKLEGTYFRVAYWAEKKRTIIDVQEGPVQVRPVVDANARKFGAPVAINEGCWCAPSDQCFLPGIPSDKPQPCTKLTEENANYLGRTTKAMADHLERDGKHIAPGPELGGLTHTPTPLPGVAPLDELDFGNVEIETEAAKSFTITNISSLPLKVKSVSVIDSINYFRISSDTCSNTELEMGKACNIGVSFKPKDFGNFIRVVQISDNAKDSPRSVIVRGRGIPSWSLLTSIEPLSLQFEKQAVGTVSSAQPIHLSTNKPIAAPTLEGSGKDDFKIISNNCTNDKVSSCEIMVAFTPAVAGNREANLVITPAGAQPGSVQPRKVIALHGVGTPAAANPAADLSPHMKITTSEVCFNAHKVVDPKAAQVRKTERIPVMNTGLGPLLITKITPTSNDFVVQSPDCTNSPITKQCEILVGFAPKTTGVRSGKLIISSNDPSEPAKEIKLGGRGKDRNWLVRGFQWLFRINQGKDCEF